MTQRVKGLSELLATLRKLPNEFKGDPTRRGLRVGAGLIRDDAAQRAPVDEGGLSANIVARNIPPRYLPPGAAAGLSIMGSRAGKAGDPKNAYYYAFVELGTKNQAAQPFLRPAFESQKGNAVSAYADEFRRNIDRAVERAKR